MPISNAIYKKDTDNLVLKDLQFNNPLPNDKCIELRNCNNVKIINCTATNFAKRFVDLRNCKGVEISGFMADAKMNATQDFCQGISIGASGVPADACHDIYIHDGTIKNIAYGGTSKYPNGDAITIEEGCTGLRIERVILDTFRDAGTDSKSPYKSKDIVVTGKGHRGLRQWIGLADIENYQFTGTLDEDLWLGANGSYRLKNVVNLNRKLKIMDDNGPVADNDPRIEWVTTPQPPVPPVNSLEARVAELERWRNS